MTECSNPRSYDDARSPSHLPRRGPRGRALAAAAAGEVGVVSPPVGPPKRTRDAILAALVVMPDELGRILAGRPTETLKRPGRDGGWGVIEIVAHLRDWEEINLERARHIVAEDGPRLPTYDDELWPIERDYRGQDPWKTLERFRTLRGELVGLLQGLAPEAWERTAEHGAYGEITLHWLADHICDHDKEHLDQVRDTLA